MALSYTPYGATYYSTILLPQNGELGNETTLGRPLKQLADNIEYLKTSLDPSIYEPLIGSKKSAFNVDFASDFDVSFNNGLSTKATRADDPRLTDARVPKNHLQPVSTITVPDNYRGHILAVDTSGNIVPYDVPTTTPAPTTTSAPDDGVI